MRDRIQALASIDSARRVFGTSGHGFRDGPRLSETEIAAAETQLGCHFPPGYRTFLAAVGDVRAGPGYGLFPVRSLGDVEWRTTARLPAFGALSAPFPHRADWNAVPSWIHEASDTPGHVERLNEWETAYFAAHWIDGALQIAHLGCAMWVLLVLNGPEAGSIWVDHRASDQGIGRHAPSFEDWYLTWLAEAEQTARHPPPPPPGNVRYFAINPDDGSIRQIENP